MELSIIIPVYNSEKAIETVVEKIQETLSSRLEFEIILINDGSKDDSLQKCKSLSAVRKNIKTINLSKNFGQHNAILAGLAFTGGDFIIFMDDDLQTPPEEIWKLIDRIKEGYDVVYANYSSKYHSWFKNMGSKVNDIMGNILLKKPSNIKTTSYFIIRKFLVNELLNYKGPYPYLAGLIFRATDNVGSVLVEHRRRDVGQSNYTFRSLFRLWLNGFTNFSIKPLRISFFLGILSSSAGFIAAIIFIIRKLIDPMVVIGWTSIIVVILFFSGIQLIIVGMVGEYIGRIFLTQNKQPQYVIKEKYNLED